MPEGKPAETGTVKKKKTIVQRPAKASWKARLGRFLGINLLRLLGIGLLVTIGFFIGVYLKMVDLDKLNNEHKIYDWPVVGEYFVKLPWERYAEYRAKKEEEDRLAAEAEAQRIAEEEAKRLEEEKKAEAEAKKEAETQKEAEAEAKRSQALVVSNEKIEKDRQERAAAEKKRIAKLARLYTDMKPEEAAKIVDNLQDDVAVAILQRMEEGVSAKILAKLDPMKAARFSNIIFVGKRTVLTSLPDY